MFTAKNNFLITKVVRLLRGWREKNVLRKRASRVSELATSQVRGACRRVGVPFSLPTTFKILITALKVANRWIFRKKYRYYALIFVKIFWIWSSRPRRSSVANLNRWHRRCLSYLSLISFIVDKLCSLSGVAREGPGMASSFSICITTLKKKLNKKRTKLPLLRH